MILTDEQVAHLRWKKVFDGMKVLEDEITDQSRWSTFSRIVFEKDGELWAFDVERGSTECQDVDTPEEYECYQVRAVPSVKYEAV